MADVTPILISQLSAQTTLQDTDYFIVGGDDAKKITVAQMKEALGINTLNTKINANKVIDIIQYDANFGSVASDASTGEKTFEITLDAASISRIAPYKNAGFSLSARVISAEGAYGNAYSYYVTGFDSDTNKITIKSNASNLSGGAHTLTIRFMIAIFASKTA